MAQEVGRRALCRTGAIGQTPDGAADSLSVRIGGVTPARPLAPVQPSTQLLRPEKSSLEPSAQSRIASPSTERPQAPPAGPFTLDALRLRANVVFEEVPDGQGDTRESTTAEEPTGAKASSEQTPAEDSAESEATSEDGDTPGEMTPEEQERVQELKARDREVRAHEQAHKAVGGRYAGAISYELERGPDGRSYAVGGEVRIDMSEVPNDPEATIRKMQVVRRAALAPAEPSAQDRRVAAEASAREIRARAELQKANGRETSEPGQNVVLSV